MLGDKEDMENFVRGMKENAGFWLTMAGVDPRGGKLWFVGFAASACTLCLLIMTAIHDLNTSDFGPFMEAIYFIFFISLYMGFCLSFKFHPRNVFNVFRCMGQGFYDYGESLDAETRAEAERLVAASRRRKRAIVRSMSVFTTLVAVTDVLVRPPLAYLSPSQPDESPDTGMHRLVPLPFWLPVRRSTASEVSLYLVIVVTGTNALASVLAHILFFLTASEEVAVQFAVLGLGLQRAARRAASLPQPPPAALSLSLTHSFRHHQVLIRVVRDIEKIVFYPCLYLLISSGIMICITGILFLSDWFDLLGKLTYTSFMLFNMLGLLIYCYYGEMIKTRSTQVRDSLYFGDWTRDMVLLKGNFLIFQLRTQEGLAISAGGYFQLNLDTYANVLRSAYTYFNLLNAIRG